MATILPATLLLKFARTDDSGQAVHEECYVLKHGVESSLASVQHTEQTQTLNIHHSLSDKTRFFENSLPLIASSGNGDLKRALGELVQMAAESAHSKFGSFYVVDPSEEYNVRAQRAGGPTWHVC